MSHRTSHHPGMMLEMDNSELLILLDSDHQLKAKVHLVFFKRNISELGAGAPFLAGDCWINGF